MTTNIHTNYQIKCPEEVDPIHVNLESFQDFIPPNVRIMEVRGLTLNQKKNPCRWEVSIQLEGDQEVVYKDNVKRYNLRNQIDRYKPRNTNLLAEKIGITNGHRQHYWIFEYEVNCTCTYSIDDFVDPLVDP